jgi:predicted enzyme involved in methoxymalonyl-ACP biosynthesis
MLAELAARARARGAARILGRYVPTAKNAVVADLFQNLGFSPAADGLWQWPVREGVDLTHFITPSR